MDVDIRYSPSFALAVITLPPGGEVKAEAGAMTSMSGGVEIETRTQGGLLKGLKRSVLGGESFFINTFRAPSGGELTVSPTLPGDIVHMPVDNSGALMVQSGSWLASDPDVQVDTKWGGGRTFFSGEGLFLLRCFGAGDMIVSSFGAIERRTLAPDQVLKIDTGHIVAFQENIAYQVNKVGGWKLNAAFGRGSRCHVYRPGHALAPDPQPGRLRRLANSTAAHPTELATCGSGVRRGRPVCSHHPRGGGSRWRSAPITGTQARAIRRRRMGILVRSQTRSPAAAGARGRS